MHPPVLIVPGIGNSGPDHWQSRWQQKHAGLSRIAVDDWDRPERSHWVAAIERAVLALGPDTLIVAHSMGCLALAHWASAPHAPARGALLVAPPDPLGPAFPAAAHGFAPLPEQRLDIPTIMVASDDDPYAAIEHAQHYAQAWGSTLHRIGKLGHINAASGLMDWDAGWHLLASLDNNA
jgi:predicted alpha/beta hydrolase family esterase